MTRGHDRRGGFTLVEVLVSMAILGVLVAFLFGALRQGGDVVTRGSARVESFSSARAALDFMTRELAQIVGPVFIRKPLPYVLDSVPPFQGIVPFFLATQQKGGEPQSTVYALANVNDSVSSRRKTVEVGYLVEFQQPDADDPTTWVRRLVRKYSADKTDAFDGASYGLLWYLTFSSTDEVVRHVASFEVEHDQANPSSWNKVADIPRRLRIRLGLVMPTDAVDAWRRVREENDPEEAWIEDVFGSDLVRVFETSVSLLNAN